MRKSVSIEKLPQGYRVRYWTLLPTGAYKRHSQWFEEWDEARSFKVDKQKALLAKAQGQVDPTLRPIDIFRLYLQTLANDPDYRQETLDLKYMALNHYVIGLSKMQDLAPKRLLVYLQSSTTKEGKPYSPNTVNLRLRELRAFNNWCVSQGYLLDNLFTVEKENGKKEMFHIPGGVEVGRKLELEEVERIWKAAKPSLRCFLSFLIYTGARYGETYKAKWQHIDFKKKRWTIPAENNKTKLEKTIPLNDFVIEMLRIKGPQHEGRIFGKNNYNSWFKETVERAGVNGRVRPHDLRHTFATHWHGDTRVLMDNMGWKTAAMLKKYSHFTVENIRKEAESKGIAASINLPTE